MCKFFRSLLAMSLALSIPLAASALPPSSYGGDMLKVDVTAQKNPVSSLLEVRRACPKIDQALQDTLAYAWRRIDKPGEFEVRFLVKGSGVTHITPTGGPRAYGAYIRWAVGASRCETRSVDGEQFNLRIRVVAPPDSDTEQSVSVLVD